MALSSFGDFNNSEANKRRIHNAALMRGIDPRLALAVSSLETGGKFNADARNPKSSATGLFQSLNNNWKSLKGDPAKRMDPNEQARVGAEGLMANNGFLAKALSRPPSNYENYMAHLLGPEGARRVLSANDNDMMLSVAQGYDPKNANAIVNNNGMAGMTVGQAKKMWESKYSEHENRLFGRASAPAGPTNMPQSMPAIAQPQMQQQATQQPVVIRAPQEPAPAMQQQSQTPAMPMQDAQSYEGGFTAGDAQAEMQGTARRREMAQALMAQNMGNRPTQTASGGMAVRQSPLEFLSRGAGAYMANQAIGAADAADQATSRKKSEALAKALGDLQSAQTPQLSPYGQGMTGSMDEQDIPAQKMQAPNPQNVQGAALRLGSVIGADNDIARAALVAAMSGPKQTEFDTKPQSDQNGKQFVVGKDGSVKYLGGGAISARDKPDVINAGPVQIAVNPFNGQEAYRVTSGASPDAQLRVTAEQQAAQLRQQQEISKEQRGDIPAGYRRRADGGVEVLPGFDPNANKTLNDVQSKALLFGSRMRDAESVLGAMAAQGTDMPGMIKQGAEGVPIVGPALGAATNWTQSANQQSVEQAQRDFINAALRRESGAAISASEFDNAKKQYFPQVGDSEQVKKQKSANRALAINGIMAEVPEGQRKLPNVAPSKPAANPSDGWSLVGVR